MSAKIAIRLRSRDTVVPPLLSLRSYVGSKVIISYTSLGTRLLKRGVQCICKTADSAKTPGAGSGHETKKLSPPPPPHPHPHHERVTTGVQAGAFVV